MEPYLDEYRSIIIDHYIEVENHVDVFFEKLNLKESNKRNIDNERDKILEKIDQYKKKNSDQLANVNFSIENQDKLLKFERREIINKLIFKDGCIYCIKSDDLESKCIFIICPCYLSESTRFSLK